MNEQDMIDSWPEQLFDRRVHLPFRMIGNPLLESELQRRQWPSGKATMRRYLNRALLWSAVLTVAYAIGDTILSGSALPGPLPELDVIAVLTIGVMLALDLYYVLGIIARISREMVSGHWDLLRITGLKEECIFEAKYVLAQIDAWRPMSIEIALRLAGVLLFMWGAIFPIYAYGGISGVFRLVFNPFAVLAWLAVVGAAIPYIIEPLWRMKAFIALGLAISSHVRHTAFALLAAQIVILVVHGLDIAFIVGLWFFLIDPGPQLNNDSFLAVLLCTGPIFLVILICFPYFPYQILRNRALDFAFKRLFRS